MPFYYSYSNKNTYNRRPATRSYAYSRSTYPSRLSGSGAYRYRRTIRGRGAYSYDKPGPFGRAGEAVGSLLGGTYGGSVGKYALGKAGRYIGHKVGRLFGSGAYGVDTGSTTVMAPDPPKFSNDSSDDSITITHREYLGDIVTSSTAGAFKIESYGLNPSEINTFPWLSAIAAPNYQQFRFEGLVFEFRSFSADALNSTNTALGSVFSCINYDYNDANPSSRYEVENTDWSKSAKPSESFMVPVECATKQTAGNGLFYVINGNNIPPNVDPKTYYLGKLWIGTTGFQGESVNVGSLYVTYKIKLYKPVMTRPLSQAHIYLSSRTSAFSNTLWGGAELVNPNNCDTIGVSIFGNTLTMSHKRLVIGQRFLVMLTVNGTAVANAIPATPTIVGGIGYSYFSVTNPYDATVFNNPGSSGTTSGTLTQTYVFQVTDNTKDLTITLAGGVYPTAAILQLSIFQISGATQPGIYIP